MFFHDWIAYDERESFLVEADIGLSSHVDHLETAFSFRTRVLDYLWAGLPTVTTRGDTLAEVIDREGAGIAVPPEDPGALEAALEQLLADDALRKASAGAARRVAEAYRWSAVLQPVIDYCADPVRSPDLQAPDTARAIAHGGDLLAGGWRERLPAPIRQAARRVRRSLGGRGTRGIPKTGEVRCGPPTGFVAGRARRRAREPTPRCRNHDARMKVNLGSGNSYIEGWVNVDSNPDVRADVYMEAFEFIRMQGSEIDELYMGHFLEHLMPASAAALLALVADELPEGARVSAVVPDMRAIFAAYDAGEITNFELNDRYVYSYEQPSHHVWCHDASSLAAVFAHAGYRDVEPIDPLTWEPVYWKDGPESRWQIGVRAAVPASSVGSVGTGRRRSEAPEAASRRGRRSAAEPHPEAARRGRRAAGRRCRQRRRCQRRRRGRRGRAGPGNPGGHRAGVRSRGGLRGVALRPPASIGGAARTPAAAGRQPSTPPGAFQRGIGAGRA